MDYYFIVLVGGSLVILACLACIFWFGGFLLPIIFGGGPFVPTSNKTTKLMVEIAKIKPTDHVTDLGSGDGRLLIAAVQAGAATADGYEIHPGLVWVSRLKNRAQKMSERIVIYQKTFWEADLSKTTVVLLYQIPDSMKRLEEKLRRELPSGARVVSHAFLFTTWQPAETHGKIRLYKV